MKKIYLISTIAIILGITVGISYFVLRDLNAKIPNGVSLETQNGKVYNFDNEKKIKLVEFIYTNCPDVCPTTTQKMKLLKNDLEKAGILGEKVELLTVTIDPARDTKEVLQRYMKSFEIENDGNWIFLTGNQQEIKKIADTFQFQYRDPGNGFFIHTTYTYLIDGNNKYMKKFEMGDKFNKDEVYATILDEI